MTGDSTFEGFKDRKFEAIICTERNDGMNQTEIGKFIAACRKNKNLTQTQLAERLNTTNKSVSKWENGSCLPDAALYEPLCDILGITINELFAGRRIAQEDYQRTADANLMQMLKYKLYQMSDKSIAFAEFDHALSKMAEVTTILQQFEAKEEAVGYLQQETNLLIEECAAAYDFYMKMFKTE